jgi:mannose-1-phosphate guanylyltransferase
LVYSGTKRLIATVGLADLAIVDTPDALLICSRDQAQNVREIVKMLEQGRYRKFR